MKLLKTGSEVYARSVAAKTLKELKEVFTLNY